MPLFMFFFPNLFSLPFIHVIESRGAKDISDKVPQDGFVVFVFSLEHRILVYCMTVHLRDP